MGSKSFLVYFDLEDQTKDFSDAQIGLLLRAMFAYARRGEIMEINDPFVATAFRFVMVQLREDQERYERRCAANRENGQHGGRPKKEK